MKSMFYYAIIHRFASSQGILSLCPCFRDKLVLTGTHRFYIIFSFRLEEDPPFFARLGAFAGINSSEFIGIWQFEDLQIGRAIDFKKG